MLRAAALIALAAALLLTAILTWGSIGSAVMVFCLITMGAALLIQKFLINRDSDAFQEE